MAPEEKIGMHKHLLFHSFFPIATMCTNKDNDPAHNGVAGDFFVFVE